MPQIIDERHSAFIKGRQLLHGFLVANEVVEEARRCLDKSLTLAFSWDFVSTKKNVNYSWLRI